MHSPKHITRTHRDPQPPIHMCAWCIYTQNINNHTVSMREGEPCMIWVYGFYEQLHRAGYHQQWHNFPQALHYQTNQCFPFWILSNHLQQSHPNILRMLPEISEISGGGASRLHHQEISRVVTHKTWKYNFILTWDINAISRERIKSFQKAMSKKYDPLTPQY